MFPNRFFPARFFASRFWPAVGAESESGFTLAQKGSAYMAASYFGLVQPPHGW